MFHRILQLLDYLKRTMSYNLRSTYSYIFAPKSILTVSNDEDSILMNVRIDKNPYCIAQINQGKIYTNCRNISVISGRYLLRDVSWQYFNGKVLSDNENFILTKRNLIHQPPKRINGTVVSLLAGWAEHNYYHWMFDCLPRFHMIKLKCKAAPGTKFLIPGDDRPYQKETLGWLGISAAERISSKKHQHIQANHLIATTAQITTPSVIPNWIIKFLRDSFLQFSSENNFSDFIYIDRADDINTRRIVNEADLIESLKSVGFATYILSDLSVGDQIALFSNAKIIVGVHGAGFTNLVFASKGTIVYEIFSNQYTPEMYKKISHQLGLEYNQVICGSDNVTDNPQRTNMQIPLYRVHEIMQLAQQMVV